MILVFSPGLRDSWVLESTLAHISSNSSSWSSSLPADILSKIVFACAALCCWDGFSDRSFFHSLSESRSGCKTHFLKPESYTKSSILNFEMSIILALYLKKNGHLHIYPLFLDYF